ncbi:MAG TPA: hypothetical protein VJL29_07345 [Thermoguttaceae bacterium]|nr:hypothetical protein [Thermoguttaceae bacterium]
MFAMAYLMAGPCELFFVVLMSIAIVFPFWLIFQKAGFPGALALLMLIPLVQIVMIFYLAFADWPALQDQEANKIDDRT